MRRIVGMVAALSVSIAAMAQEYPSRPVKIVLPYPLGGPGDFISRTVGEKLQQKLGQPFLIEPRPGANLRMGTEFLAKSAPDGYTIAFIGVPRPILDKLNAEVNAALAMPDVKEKFANAGLVPVGGSMEQFDKLIRSEMQRWGRVIRERGIKPD